MKKILFSIFVVIVFIAAGCGGTAETKAQKPQKKVIETAANKADWLAEGIKVVKNSEGKKEIAFVCAGEHANKNMALSLSKMHCANYVSAYFQEIIARELDGIINSSSFSAEEKNQYKTVLIDTKNINVSGLEMASTWWQFVAKPEASGQYRNVFEYYTRNLLSYERFLSIIEAVKQNTKVSVNGKTLPADIIEKLNKKLDELKDKGETVIASNAVLGLEN